MHVTRNNYCPGYKTKKKERENDQRVKLQHGGVGVGMRTVDLSKVHNCVVSSSSYHDPADKIFL